MTVHLPIFGPWLKQCSILKRTSLGGAGGEKWIADCSALRKPCRTKPSEVAQRMAKPELSLGALALLGLEKRFVSLFTPRAVPS